MVNEVIALWPGGAPGSEGWTQVEQEDVIPPSLKVVRNVTQPTLTAYLPEPARATGTAVVVCPGGGFHFLSIDMEGTDVACWLNARGVAAFVLKYRLIRTGDDFPAVVWQNLNDRARMDALEKPLVPLVVADGLQAIRLVRRRAAEWAITPDRIGIMGFSAGGMVTVGAMTQYSGDNRPDFAAPIYAAITSDFVVPADAPPAFVLSASDDAMGATNSLRLYNAWRAAGCSAELHLYAQGGHGFGMQTRGLPSDTWIERFGDWLGGQGL